MNNPDIPAVAQQMVEAVRAAVAKSETALNARIDAIAAQLGAIPAPAKGEKGDRGDAGRDGKDGQDGAPWVLVKAQIADEAKNHPGPKGDKGEPGAAGKDAEAVDLPALHTLVKAWIQDAVKLVVPRDGMPGRDGRDATGLPGKDGKDGKDGFSIDDFSMALADDGRTLSLKFARGETVVERSIKLETLIWRDTWREAEYERGDVVTWGGSSWHCQAKTSGKPGECDDWKMMVKKGSAGRDWNDPKAKHEHKVVRTA